MTSKKETLSVSLSKLILTVSIIVCISALFGAVGYLALHSQKINVPVVNPVVNQDICDIGKGDWGNGNGIFTENNASLNIARQKCEVKSDCRWKFLGGEVTSHFACCPKDLNNIITDDNRKLYERCFIIID